MPLPLIAVAVGTGLYGVYKTGRAAVDSSTASDINSSAENIVKKANKNLDAHREEANTAFQAFGAHKVEAITKSLDRFVQVYSQLKNVDLTDNVRFDELPLAQYESKFLKEVRNEVSMLQSSSMGILSGTAGGAATAFGAYGGAMMLASASTGTAISTLSGAAATNATLAWFGGGALTSGGMGMAGGVMVLGGIVAGPALAIFGSVLGASSNKKLSDAKSNLEEAKTLHSETEIVVTQLDGLIQVALLASEVLSKLRTQLRRSVKKLQKVIDQSGMDYANFSNDQKELVFKTVKLAQLVKVVTDQSILDEDGALEPNAEETFSKIKNELSA